MKPSGIITLMSDFGLQDSYVGEMKGVLLSINPKAALVDLGHEVPAGEVAVAALRLWRSHRHFPRGTVHLAVVDPGVGTSRKLLLAVSKEYFFLAPDNGLLSPISQETSLRCYALDALPWKGSGGSTFHGRDLLAPAAAYLSLGRPPGAFGRPLASVRSLSLWAVNGKKEVTGKIIDIDHFGNLITNIRASQVMPKRKFSIRYREFRFRGLAKTYGGAKGNRPVALIASSGLLELALPQGNAKKRLGGTLGEKVTVRYE